MEAKLQVVTAEPPQPLNPSSPLQGSILGSCDIQGLRGTCDPICTP